MTEHVSWILGECLKMGLHIREQEIEIFSLMIMCDHPSRDAPEPLNAVGIGIIGRGIDQVQLLLQLGEQATYQEGTSGSVSLEVVGNHDSHTSATCGARNRGTHLFTEHISGASRIDPAIEPAIAPVHQAKAVDLAIVSRRLDQALPTTPFAAPDTGKGRMKGKLDLILQIEIGLRQESEQVGQVGGKVIPQVSLDEIFDG
jgi:hypothetical protein